jgi:hypothetical protein
MKPHHKCDLEVGPGRIIQKLSEEEVQKLTNQWMDIYARNTQKKILTTYLWHTFSSGSYPSVCRREAELLYTQQITNEVVVLSNNCLSALVTDALPKNCNLMDYFVFPTNLAWTIAFTHEDGWLGPYFAKHPNYNALVLQEIERGRAIQRKAQEIARAKQEGWL